MPDLREDPRDWSAIAAGRSYTLDGEPVDLAAFVEANGDGLSAGELGAVAALRPGQQMTFGGGAAATFVLRCLFTKLDLIRMLEGIPGNPEVVVMSGFLDPEGSLDDIACHTIRDVHTEWSRSKDGDLVSVEISRDPDGRCAIGESGGGDLCTRCGTPLGLNAFRVPTEDGERHLVCPDAAGAEVSDA